MGWVAALGGTILNGFLGKKASDKATDAQVDASQQNLALQQQMWQQQMANQQPFMQYGQGAGGLGGLQQLASGDYSGFYNSPDYTSARDAMQYAGDHGAAARGRVFSGGFAKDMAEAQGDLANQYLNNYRGSLQWGANLGQSAASNQAQASQNYANQAGNAFGQIGNAQASGALTNANIYGNTLGGLAGIFGASQQNKTASSYAPNGVQLPANPSMPHIPYQF